MLVVILNLESTEKASSDWEDASQALAKTGDHAEQTALYASSSHRSIHETRSPCKYDGLHCLAFAVKATCCRQIQVLINIIIVMVPHKA